MMTSLRIVVVGTDKDVALELPAGSSGDVPDGTGSAVVREVVAVLGDAAAGRRRFEVTVDGWVIEVSAEPAGRALLRERALRSGGGAGHSGPQPVRTRLPGRIARIWVEVGHPVAVGDRLLSVEAMKMENEVRSPVAGVVQAISVAVGDRVELHAELVVIAS